MRAFSLLTFCALHIPLLSAAPTVPTNTILTDHSTRCLDQPSNPPPGDPSACLEILDNLPTDGSITFAKGLASTSFEEVPTPFLLSSQAFRGRNNNNNLTLSFTHTSELSSRAPLGVTIDECLLTASFPRDVERGYKEQWEFAEFKALALDAWRDCMEGQAGRMFKLESGGLKRLQFEMKVTKNSNPWPTEIGEKQPPATGSS